MQPRHYKGIKIEKGYKPIVTPQDTGLKYIEFGRLVLPEKGAEYESETLNREVVLTVFSGTCNIEIESPSQKASYKTIGKRTDVFAGRPAMVYLPRNTAYRVVSESSILELGISKAPSEMDYEPVLVKPEDVFEGTFGVWNWRRKIHMAVGESVKAQRLLVGETLNPSGNWSSFPPHKHDVESSSEAPLEEVYFFKVKPSQGFGFQRVYTAADDQEPFDKLCVIEDNDTVVIPRGYHPVVAAPGYQLYYLWILAGEKRIYGAWSDDPRHTWLRGCEPILRDVLHNLK